MWTKKKARKGIIACVNINFFLTQKSLLMWKNKLEAKNLKSISLIFSIILSCLWSKFKQEKKIEPWEFLMLQLIHFCKLNSFLVIQKLLKVLYVITTPRRKHQKVSQHQFSVHLVGESKVDFTNFSVQSENQKVYNSKCGLILEIL